MKIRFVILMAAVLCLLSVGVATGGLSDGVAASGGSISGVVYFDTDMDGIRDSGEHGAPGRTVELHELLGDVYETLHTTESDGSGRYEFRELAQNREYELNVRIDENTPCFSGPFISLQPGGEWSGLDMGVLGAGKGRVAGTVVNDVDGDGVIDTGDGLLEGWIVSVEGPNESVNENNSFFCNFTGKSDRGGEFDLSVIDGFSYEISIYPPEDQIKAYWSWTLPLTDDPENPNWGGPDHHIDLQERPEVLGLGIGVHIMQGTATVSGSAYVDSDLNGSWDAEEALLDCNMIPPFVMISRHFPFGPAGLHGNPSCEGGHFTFAGLEAGTYRVFAPEFCGTTEESNKGTSQTVTVVEGETADVTLRICDPMSVPAPEAMTPESTPTSQPVVATPTPAPTASIAALPVSAPGTGTGDGAGRGSSATTLLVAAIALAVMGAGATTTLLLRRDRYRRWGMSRQR